MTPAADGSPLRVTLALQFFHNAALIECFGRVAACASRATIALDWRLVVNNDDGVQSHVQRWQTSLATFGANATLLVSGGIHELRAYNTIARMFDADLVIMLQDDDLPPVSCEWLERLLHVTRHMPHVGLIGMRRAETPVMANGATRMRLARNSSSCDGTVCLCHGKLGLPMRYAARVDLAPMAVRPAAFGRGFPTKWTPAGVPGIGMDFFLSQMVWEAGWRVLHLPAPNQANGRFVEVISRPREVGNSQGRVRNAQWDTIQRVLKRRFYGEAAERDMARRVALLNDAEMVVCAGGGGEGGEWRARRVVARRDNARAECT